MANVDHSFSTTDEDDAVIDYIANRTPIREITLAVSLLIFGVTGIILGIFHVGDETNYLGMVLTIVGVILFIPGFYYARISESGAEKETINRDMHAFIHIGQFNRDRMILIELADAGI